jgi:peptidoglycan/xylan/chitin deacetylase (PgdA/CDA1 family)
MKKKLKYIYTSLLGLIKTPTNNVHILNGHDFNSNKSIKNNIEDFRLLLSELQKNNVLISFEKAKEMLNKGCRVNKPHIAFSFDDGFEDCFRIAIILEEYDITGGFFICPEYIDGMRDDLPKIGYLYKFNKRFLKLDELEKMLDSGHTIGAHTYSHINLDDLSGSNEVYREIIYSKEKIETVLKIRCEDFAVPYGQYTKGQNNLMFKIQKKYKNIFLSDNRFKCNIYKKMFNRRQFDCDWNINQINYFLSQYK